MSEEENESATEDEIVAGDDSLQNTSCTDDEQQKYYDLHEALEQRIDQAVDDREHNRKQRHQGGLIDQATQLAMEEPLLRLVGAVVLFENLAEATCLTDPPSPFGLSFLARTMQREAVRLYRLYHGQPPDF